eukprot:scaffold1172_cov180-Ochromonas_danica.AAC.19
MQALISPSSAYLTSPHSPDDLQIELLLQGLPEAYEDEHTIYLRNSYVDNLLQSFGSTLPSQLKYHTLYLHNQALMDDLGHVRYLAIHLEDILIYHTKYGIQVDGSYLRISYHSNNHNPCSDEQEEEEEDKKVMESIQLDLTPLLQQYVKDQRQGINKYTNRFNARFNKQAAKDLQTRPLTERFFVGQLSFNSSFVAVPLIMDEKLVKNWVEHGAYLSIQLCSVIWMDRYAPCSTQFLTNFSSMIRGTATKKELNSNQAKVKGSPEGAGSKSPSYRVFANTKIPLSGLLYAHNAKGSSKPLDSSSNRRGENSFRSREEVLGHNAFVNLPAASSSSSPAVESAVKSGRHCAFDAVLHSSLIMQEDVLAMLKSRWELLGISSATTRRRSTIKSSPSTSSNAQKDAKSDVPTAGSTSCGVLTVRLQLLEYDSPYLPPNKTDAKPIIVHDTDSVRKTKKASSDIPVLFERTSDLQNVNPVQEQAELKSREVDHASSLSSTRHDRDLVTEALQYVPLLPTPVASVPPGREHLAALFSSSSSRLGSERRIARDAAIREDQVEVESSLLPSEEEAEVETVLSDDSLSNQDHPIRPLPLLLLSSEEAKVEEHNAHNSESDTISEIDSLDGMEEVKEGLSDGRVGEEDDESPRIFSPVPLPQPTPLPSLASTPSPAAGRILSFDAEARSNQEGDVLTASTEGNKDDVEIHGEQSNMACHVLDISIDGICDDLYTHLFSSNATLSAYDDSAVRGFFVCFVLPPLPSSSDIAIASRNQETYFSPPPSSLSSPGLLYEAASCLSLYWDTTCSLLNGQQRFPFHTPKSMFSVEELSSGLGMDTQRGWKFYLLPATPDGELPWRPSGGPPPPAQPIWMDGQRYLSPTAEARLTIQSLHESLMRLQRKGSYVDVISLPITLYNNPSSSTVFTLPIKISYRLQPVLLRTALPAPASSITIPPSPAVAPASIHEEQLQLKEEEKWKQEEDLLHFSIDAPKFSSSREKKEEQFQPLEVTIGEMRHFLALLRAPSTTSSSGVEVLTSSTGLLHEHLFFTAQLRSSALLKEGQESGYCSHLESLARMSSKLIVPGVNAKSVELKTLDSSLGLRLDWHESFTLPLNLPSSVYDIDSQEEFTLFLSFYRRISLFPPALSPLPAVISSTTSGTSVVRASDILLGYVRVPLPSRWLKRGEGYSGWHHILSHPDVTASPLMHSSSSWKRRERQPQESYGRVEDEEQLGLNPPDGMVMFNSQSLGQVYLSIQLGSKEIEVESEAKTEIVVDAKDDSRDDVEEEEQDLGEVDLLSLSQYTTKEEEDYHNLYARLEEMQKLTAALLTGPIPSPPSPPPPSIPPTLLSGESRQMSLLEQQVEKEDPFSGLPVPSFWEVPPSFLQKLEQQGQQAEGGELEYVNEDFEEEEERSILQASPLNDVEIVSSEDQEGYEREEEDLEDNNEEGSVMLFPPDSSPSPSSPCRPPPSLSPSPSPPRPPASSSSKSSPPASPIIRSLSSYEIPCPSPLISTPRSRSEHEARTEEIHQIAQLSGDPAQHSSSTSSSSSSSTISSLIFSGDMELGKEVEKEMEDWGLPFPQSEIGTRQEKEVEASQSQPLSPPLMTVASPPSTTHTPLTPPAAPAHFQDEPMIVMTQQEVEILLQRQFTQFLQNIALPPHLPPPPDPLPLSSSSIQETAAQTEDLIATSPPPSVSIPPPSSIPTFIEENASVISMAPRLSSKELFSLEPEPDSQSKLKSGPSLSVDAARREENKIARTPIFTLSMPSSHQDAITVQPTLSSRVEEEKEERSSMGLDRLHELIEQSLSKSYASSRSNSSIKGAPAQAKTTSRGGSVALGLHKKRFVDKETQRVSEIMFSLLSTPPSL